MEILKFLFICLEVLLLFNLLILVHELGHFLAARWRGLEVDKFAIWFGKPLWKAQVGGVEYRLGCIPAGGYVSIPQMAPMEAVEGKTNTPREELPLAKPMDKIIVAAAGPLFSLGLALVFAVLVWMIGRPVSEGELSTTIGFVVPDGPAAAAGLLPGDKITAVAGKPVSRFAGMGNVSESIVWNIAGSEGPLIPVEFERDGVRQTVWVESVAPKQEGIGRRQLRQIGIAPAMTPRIAKVMANSPASEAGLKPGDLVLAVNDLPLLSMASLAEFLDKYPGGPISLKIERDGKAQQIEVLPQVPEAGTAPRIGVQWDERGRTVVIHPNPIDQITGTLRTMAATISAVIAPNNEIGLQHLSGPVGIMRFYYMIFEAPDGWRVALWFSVFLNVNLAVLNLLPLPVLDGGHIVMAIIEAIRRKPINVRLLEFIQSAFAILLIGFMLYVTFFDSVDLFGRKPKQEAPAEFKFSPTPQSTEAPAP